MLAFLVAFQASALCVTSTDVCAPPGSTLTGTISQSGGQVTITPSQPLRALGAVFRAGAPVTVDVARWSSSDGTRGAIVHVRGELAQRTKLSGAPVAGTVTVGQVQGRRTPPQLVEATDFERGQLTLGAAGAIDVAPGMRLAGRIDLGGAHVEVTGTAPIRALGLEFVAGRVRIEQRASGTSLAGTLARPQRVGGVLVAGEVYATLEPTKVRFPSATLAEATPLRVLGLPEGEAPAGTIVRTQPAATHLLGPGPLTVCGLALTPGASYPQPAVTFTAETAGVAVTGTLVGAAVDVGGGMHLRGAVTLRYGTGSCQPRGVEGTLARVTLHRGLRFAANSVFSSGALPSAGDVYVRGTLAAPATVGGLLLGGTVMLRATPNGDLHLIEGTLANAARFEQWQLPAGTQVTRHDAHWSFTTPARQAARAVAPHRGERVDHVLEARSDHTSTSFTLLRPHTPQGSRLALRSLGIDHASGCVLGDVSPAQRAGIFSIPASGSATLCAGRIVAAQGVYAVPSLQVGRWYATEIIAGDPGSPPSRGPAALPTVSALAGTTGYWIQINSLCQGPTGIPVPPPPTRWIWVDHRGDTPDARDRKELAARAAKRGTACPVTPCCPP